MHVTGSVEGYWRRYSGFVTWFHFSVWKAHRSQMKFCPGITEEKYDQYWDVLRYNQKSVLISEEPFERICSVQCKLWCPIARSCSKAQKQSSEVMCVEYITLREFCWSHSCFFRRTKKVQYQQSSSHYPLYLSPASQKIHENNRKAEQAEQKRLLQKYVPEEVELDDDQHDEMCRIHSAVEDHANEYLGRCFLR